MNMSGLTPVGFCVLIELDKQSDKIGSLYVPQSIQDKDKLATQEGTLIAVSPHAFTYAERWPEGSKPVVGQRVLFKRYEGHLHDRDGRTYRLMEDKSLVAIVADESVKLERAA